MRSIALERRECRSPTKWSGRPLRSGDAVDVNVFVYEFADVHLDVHVFA